MVQGSSAGYSLSPVWHMKSSLNAEVPTLLFYLSSKFKNKAVDCCGSRAAKRKYQNGYSVHLRETVTYDPVIIQLPNNHLLINDQLANYPVLEP